MVRITDEVLILLGLDSTKFKAGLATASTASKKFLDQLKAHSTQLAGLSLASGVSFAAQAAFIKDVTGEFAAQETAVNKLESLLKAEQRTRAGAVKTLTDQADAMQRVTAFSDEQVISMQATLAAFGQTDTEIARLVPALLDTAAGFRDVNGEALDLDAVAKAVGKTLGGNSTALQRLGIDLHLAKGEAVTAEQVFAALEERFGGAAEAAGTTFAGKMKIAEHQISDVKEAIGSALAPAIIDLTDKIIPAVTRFGEWASAHKDVVLAIMGGGIAGAGLIAAVSAAGLALSVFGAATGPVGVTIIAVSALVGWLIKLKLAQESLPTTIEGVTAALAKTQEQLDNLKASLDHPLGRAQGGATFGGTLAQIAELEKRITALREAQKTLTQEGGAAFTGPPRPTPLETATDSEIEKQKDLLKWRQRVMEGRDLGGEALTELGAVEPMPRESIVGPFKKSMDEIITTQDAAFVAMEDRARAHEETERDRLEREHEVQVSQAQGMLASYENSFLAILDAEKNFGAAMAKGAILTVLKIIHAKIQEAMAELLVTKIKEVGKAAMAGPLSFGASLAAIGPIIAGYSAAVMALHAVEGKLSKGFELGGVVPYTGHMLVHEGEVIFNPRRNTTAELASNLARAGASKEAGMLRENTGGGVVNHWNIKPQFWGPLNTQVDLDQAFKQLAGKINRAHGPGV